MFYRLGLYVYIYMHVCVCTRLRVACRDVGRQENIYRLIWLLIPESHSMPKKKKGKIHYSDLWVWNGMEYLINYVRSFCLRGIR